MSGRPQLSNPLTVNLKTMDGPPPAGRVLAVDHDRLFKELLTTFFFEFLDLFFPRLAAQIDRESIASSTPIIPQRAPLWLK